MILNPKLEVWKILFLFNWVIFKVHVNLQGCRTLYHPVAEKYNVIYIITSIAVHLSHDNLVGNKLNQHTTIYPIFVGDSMSFNCIT